PILAEMASTVARRLYLPGRPAPGGWPVARLGLAVLVLFALLVGADLISLFDLSTGETVVIGIRMLVPVLILRWWLVGGVAAMLVDGLDVVITDALDMGGFGSHYAELDKVLDTYYLTLELLVALTWQNAWARIPAVGLFAYRLVGFVLFEVTGQRIMLFIFPNVFEIWWLYCVVVMKWFPGAVPGGWKSLLVPMVLLLVPKMAQEYLLHFAEAKPWGWIQENILAPVGIDF
ncbi:MAG: hypothetical protein WEC33_07000, partial [Dehalococcoidia bacterium]